MTGITLAMGATPLAGVPLCCSPDGAADVGAVGSGRSHLLAARHVTHLSAATAKGPGVSTAMRSSGKAAAECPPGRVARPRGAGREIDRPTSAGIGDINHVRDHCLYHR